MSSLSVGSPAPVTWKGGGAGETPRLGRHSPWEVRVHHVTRGVWTGFDGITSWMRQAREVERGVSSDHGGGGGGRNESESESYLNLDHIQHVQFEVEAQGTNYTIPQTTRTALVPIIFRMLHLYFPPPWDSNRAVDRTRPRNWERHHEPFHTDQKLSTPYRSRQPP